MTYFILFLSLFLDNVCRHLGLIAAGFAGEGDALGLGFQNLHGAAAAVGNDFQAVRVAGSPGEAAAVRDLRLVSLGIQFDLRVQLNGGVSLSDGKLRQLLLIEADTQRRCSAGALRQMHGDAGLLALAFCRQGHLPALAASLSVVSLRSNH